MSSTIEGLEVKSAVSEGSFDDNENANRRVGNRRGVTLIPREVLQHLTISRKKLCLPSYLDFNCEGLGGCTEYGGRLKI